MDNQLNTLMNGMAATLIPLANIDRQTAFTQLDRRERDLVNIRGFKICLHMRNNTLTTRVHFHVALLCPKEGLTVQITDFFRGNGAADRNIDFNTVQTNFLTTYCNGINTDLYTILFHKRYTIDYNNDTGVGLFGKRQNNYVFFHKYVKMKRQMRYDGTNATPESNPPILMLWYDDYNRGTGAAASTGAIELSTHIVTYWRDAL